MPAPLVGVGVPSDFFRDIRSEFLSTYETRRASNAMLSKIMRLGVPSTTKTERYGYYESLPSLARQDRGTAVAESAFGGVSYSVTNHVWSRSVGFNQDDASDTKLGDLLTYIRGLSIRAADVAERVAFQILLGTTDPDLLSAIPLAPDGAALFATTAGGAARFGVTNGNLLTGSGVATAAAVRSDFWSALGQATLFQDTDGQPLLDPGFASGGVTVVYGAANEEVFREAFLQSVTVDGNAGVSNTVLQSGIPLTLWSSPRITDNDWFVSFDGLRTPALFEQTRQAPRLIAETRENSERARRLREDALIVDMRSGFGVNLPYAMLKINN